jgi:hypothetical protein
MLAGGTHVIPTKQLNSDFLAAARIGIMKHPRSVVLFPRLTSTYRDVVHSNEMLSRFERMSHELIDSRMARFRFQSVLRSTAACFPSVRASPHSLLNAAREQEALEEASAPEFWDFN